MYLSTKNLCTLEKLYHTMLDNSLIEVYNVGRREQSKKVTVNFVDYENLLGELGDMISDLENKRKDSNEKTAKYIAEKRKDNKDYGRGEKYLKERNRKRQEKNRKKAEAVFEKFREIRPRDRKPEEKLAKMRALFPSIRERGERFDRELREKRKGEKPSE